MTFLVLLAAAAPTWVVAADLGFRPHMRLILIDWFKAAAAKIVDRNLIFFCNVRTFVLELMANVLELATRFRGEVARVALLDRGCGLAVHPVHYLRADDDG